MGEFVDQPDLFLFNINLNENLVNVFITKSAKLQFEKIFQLNCFKKSIFMTIWRNKKKIAFCKSKIILARYTLDFFPCNTKQKINLTLPNLLI